MKKKTLALILTLCMTVTAVVSFTAGAAAAGGLQEIKAYLNSGITLKLDGEAQVLTDASGVRTYPITYNGTTYLPVRSIGNLLGVDVGWDQATQSVLLGKQGETDLIDTFKPFDSTKESGKGVNYIQTADKQTKDISGVSCSHWIELWTWLYYVPGETVSTSINVLGKYDTLTFQYYASSDTILRVLGDNGSVLAEISVTGGQVAKTVSVPLFKTSQLTFELEMTGNTQTSIYIFDAKLS